MNLCWQPHNWDLEGRDKTPRIRNPWHRLDLGEWGSYVIEEDWSLGHPPRDCEPLLVIIRSAAIEKRDVRAQSLRMRCIEVRTVKL